MSNFDPDLTLHASVDDAMTAPIEHMTDAVQGLGDAAAGAGRKASTTGAQGLTVFDRAAQRLRASLGGLDDRLRTISRRMTSEVGQAARRLTTALTLAGGAVATLGVRAASNFQATRLSFETLLGSVEKGGALFKQLQTLNLKTPFQLSELAAGEQLLLRYNIQGERSVGILKGLSDVAALSDDPAGNLNAMARAVGQIFTSGRLQGQDALQLVQAGINAYDVYAQKLGITQAAARKLGEAGKLDANILLDAITNLDGPLEKFRGGAEKMSQTLMGQLSNVKDALNVGLADAAQPLVGQLGALIGTPDKPGVLLSGLTSLVQTAGPPLFSLLGSVSDLVARALPAAAPIFSAISSGLERLLLAAGPSLRSLEPLGGKIGDALVALVDALVPVMPDLVDLFGAFVLILPDFVRLLTALVPLVPPIARLLTVFLGFKPVRGFMAGLLAVLLGYRALSGIVKGMWAFAGAIRGIAAAEAVADAAGGAGGAAGAAGNAAGIVPWLARGAAGAAGSVTVGGAVAVGGAALAAGGVLYLAEREKQRSRRQAASPAGQAAAGKVRRSMEGPHRAPKGLSYDWRQNPYFTSGPNGETRGDAVMPARRADRAAEAATPGSRLLTSNVRSFGVGPGSGHPGGTAFDRSGSWMARYRENVRAAGGWSTQEGNHVHADFGDASAPPRAGSGMPAAWSGGGGRALVEVHGNVYGMDELERFVHEARRRQDEQDRARARRPQGSVA